MQARRKSTSPWRVGFALLVLAGCAQPQQPASAPATPLVAAEKIPDFVPSDHWQVMVRQKGATIAATSRDAAILLGCPDRIPSVTLIVTLAAKLAVPEGMRTVTITSDDGTRLQQSWFVTDESYGIIQEQNNFAAVIDLLKGPYQRVEFVLSESGRELDRHAFSLNGAAEAIDQVLALCAKS